MKQLMKAAELRSFSIALAKKEIEWRFKPPLASHQGGLYEAFFRIVRKILRSVVGEATLDEFDLLTLLTDLSQIRLLLLMNLLR